METTISGSTVGFIMRMDVSRVAANDPAPMLVVTERITVFSPMIWIMVLAIVLLRRENKDFSK